MSAPYKIEFVVNQRYVDHASWPKHEPLSLETLSDLLVEMENGLENQQLTFTWIDDEGFHVFVANDSDLRAAIEAQAAREASTLRFHVTAVSATSPASRLPSPPNSSEAITTTNESQESVAGEMKPLVELSVAEVVSLFESLNMPAGCAVVLRDHRISGHLLSFVKSEADLKYCGLTGNVLDANSANVLLQRMPELREKGVPVAFLRNALTRSNKRQNTDLNDKKEINEDILSAFKEARLAQEREEEKERRFRILSSVQQLCTDPRWMNVSPSDFAIAERNFESVEALLERTYEMVENENEEVMILSLEERNNQREEAERRFRILRSVRQWCSNRDYGTNNRTNVSPLYLASKAGDFEGVQALLECTSEMVENESEEVKEFMRLSSEERVNRIEDHSTALHAAAEKGHAEIVRILLAYNANIEERDWYQHTPLHKAVSGGQTDTVLCLLSERANINAENEISYSPLHIASSKGCVELVFLLLAHGADENVVDQDGHTPLDIAENEEVRAQFSNALT